MTTNSLIEDIATMLEEHKEDGEYTVIGNTIIVEPIKGPNFKIAVYKLALPANRR